MSTENQMFQLFLRHLPFCISQKKRLDKAENQEDNAKIVFLSSPRQECDHCSLHFPLDSFPLFCYFRFFLKCHILEREIIHQIRKEIASYSVI